MDRTVRFAVTPLAAGLSVLYAPGAFRDCCPPLQTTETLRPSRLCSLLPDHLDRLEDSTLLLPHGELDDCCRYSPRSVVGR